VSRLRLSTILVVSPHDFPHLDSVSLIASTAPDNGAIHSKIRNKNLLQVKEQYSHKARSDASS
jgi:hypothetical protein